MFAITSPVFLFVKLATLRTTVNQLLRPFLSPHRELIRRRTVSCPILRFVRSILIVLAWSDLTIAQQSALQGHVEVYQDPSPTPITSCERNNQSLLALVPIYEAAPSPVREHNLALLKGAIDQCVPLQRCYANLDGCRRATATHNTQRWWYYVQPLPQPYWPDQTYLSDDQKADIRPFILQAEQFVNQTPQRWIAQELAPTVDTMKAQCLLNFATVYACTAAINAYNAAARAVSTGLKQEDLSNCAGRMQAQGEDIDDKRDVKERRWNLNHPPTVAEGLMFLNELESQLTGRQLKVRQNAFRRATQHVRVTCPMGGGCPPRRNYTFRDDPTNRRSSIRVDIEIFSCTSFLQ